LTDQSYLLLPLLLLLRLGLVVVFAQWEGCPLPSTYQLLLKLAQSQ
jgi:hypothetical protein